MTSFKQVSFDVMLRGILVEVFTGLLWSSMLLPKIEILQTNFRSLEALILYTENKNKFRVAYKLDRFETTMIYTKMGNLYLQYFEGTFSNIKCPSHVGIKYLSWKLIQHNEFLLQEDLDRLANLHDPVMEVESVSF